MKLVTATTTADTLQFGTLRGELDGWRLSLEAGNKSPRTLQSYSETVEQLADFLAAKRMPQAVENVKREHVEAWLKDLREAGRSEATIGLRFRSLRPFWNYLVDEEIIPVSPMAKMHGPKVSIQPTPIPPLEDVKRLLATTAGKDYEARRDRAILLLMVDSGARLSEVANIKLADVTFVGSRPDLVEITGKGGSRRTLVIKPVVAQAMRAYLRLRQDRRDARLPWLWLGRGHLLPAGVAQMIGRRAEEAGLVGIHPHVFRHAFAHAWLAAGNSESALMRVAGWKSRSMLARYGASLADERAREEHRGFSPTDLL
jgi:site-specific recombinase XerD